MSIQEGWTMDDREQTFNSYNQYDFEDPILNTQEKTMGDSDTLTEYLDQVAKKNGTCRKDIYQPRSVVRAMFRRNTLAIKQANEQKEEGTKLKRVLQWYHLMGYGFASTVGAGNYF